MQKKCLSMRGKRWKFILIGTRIQTKNVVCSKAIYVYDNIFCEIECFDNR